MLILGLYCVWTVWSCSPVWARTGKIYLKVDRPEIRRLQWRSEAVTGEDPVWREALWTSAGFEVDLGPSDALHIFVRGQAWRDPGRDWVVEQRVAVTSPLLPAVQAESRWSSWRLLVWVLLGLGLVRSGYHQGPLLGRGGSGEVYRARRGWRRVAVKRLREGQGEREIEVQSKLDHPHIVRLLDSRPGYLTMEFMEGGNLRSRLGRAYPFPEATRLLEPLFAAVAYAHSRGVVHRDLKPENILFSAEGCLKIADFGLAKSFDSPTLTETGMVQGSPAYMAPEQIQGCSRDPRLDQYALGILAYQVLTGELPFEPPWLEKHLHQPVPSLHQRLGHEVDGVLRRMLEKRPDFRYPSVDDAWQALCTALNGSKPS